MSYTVNSKNITFLNGYSLEFEYPIKETLTIGDIVIVVVESPFEVRYEQNVFALKESGDFLWRISDVKFYTNGPDSCFYSGVELNKNNELVLYNWCDTGVIVNPETGEVIRTYQTK